MNVRRIAVADIDVPAVLHRSVRNPGALQRLILSMKAAGRLLHPIRVRQLQNGRFELVAGERRLLAARVLCWTEIDAVVEVMPVTDAIATRLVETTCAEERSILEDAWAFASLEAALKAAGRPHNPAELSRITGAKKSTLSEALTLARAIPPALVDRHARAAGVVREEIIGLPRRALLPIAKADPGAEQKLLWNVVLDAVREENGDPVRAVREALRAGSAAATVGGIRIVEDEREVQILLPKDPHQLTAAEIEKATEWIERLLPGLSIRLKAEKCSPGEPGLTLANSLANRISRLWGRVAHALRRGNRALRARLRAATLFAPGA